MNPSNTGTPVSSSSSKGLAGITPLEAVRATVYTTTTPVQPLSSVLQLVSSAPTFQMPMPMPMATGIPLFEGANATEFLDRYKDLCRQYNISKEDIFNRLPWYYSRSIGDTIRILKEWTQNDYPNLRKAILRAYKKYNGYQQLYSLQFLEQFKSVKRNKDDDVLRYCQQYNMVATHLNKGILSDFNIGVWFLYRLLLYMRSKVVRKKKVDTEDADTVKYEEIYKYVE